VNRLGDHQSGLNGTANGQYDALLRALENFRILRNRMVRLENELFDARTLRQDRREYGERCRIGKDLSDGRAKGVGRGRLDGSHDNVCLGGCCHKSGDLLRQIARWVWSATEAAITPVSVEIVRAFAMMRTRRAIGAATMAHFVLAVVAAAILAWMRVRVAAREQGAQPSVQELVVRLVLANDEIVICVIRAIFVDMVNWMGRVEWSAERAFGDHDVLQHVPIARARMIRHPELYIAARHHAASANPCWMRFARRAFRLMVLEISTRLALYRSILRARRRRDAGLVTASALTVTDGH
jgi:hypothetical protein